MRFAPAAGAPSTWRWLGHQCCHPTAVTPAPVQGAGSPEFSNEVQHLVRVLEWDRDIDSSVLRRGSSLPGYVPRGSRSGRSLRVWIARHRHPHPPASPVPPPRLSGEEGATTSPPRLNPSVAPYPSRPKAGRGDHAQHGGWAGPQRPGLVGGIIVPPAPAQAGADPAMHRNQGPYANCCVPACAGMTSGLRHRQDHPP